MKRQHLLLAAAGVELLRYWGFTLVLPQIAGEAQTVFVFILGAAMSPGLLVPGLLFFFWKDTAKYASFRPAIILAKVTCIASTLAAMVFLFLYGGDAAAQPARMMLLVGSCLALDVFVLACSLVNRSAGASAGLTQGSSGQVPALDAQFETVVED